MHPGIRRSRLATTPLLLALVLLGACGEDKSLGKLAVTVSGLPAGLAPKLEVTGPNGFAQQLAGSTTLSSLSPGDYLVRAQPITAATGEYYKSEPEKATLAVAAGASASAAFTYWLDDKPQLSYSPETVELAAVLKATATGELQLFNAGHGPLEYTATAGATWVTIAANGSGTIAPGEAARVGVSAACKDAGNKQTVLSIENNATLRPQEVPVVLRCTRDPEPEIGPPEPSPLRLVGSVGTAATGALTVRNVGSAPLTWEATSSAAWLTLVAPVAGTIQATSTATLGLTANCAAVGTLTGQVAIASNDADEPSISATVELDCRNEPVPDITDPAPRPLSLSGADGERPTATLSFSNLGTAALAFAVSEQASWLEITSGGSGDLAAGASASVGLTATCAGFGEWQSLITVTSDDPDEPLLTVPVQLSCSPVAPAIAAFAASPTAIDAGQSSTLSWTVTGSQPMRLLLAPTNADVSARQSVFVQPIATTEYTLTATNGVGTATARLSIEVRAADIGAPTPAPFVIIGRLGQAAEATLSFANSGNAPLTWTATVPASWAQLTPASGSVAPGSNGQLRVSSTCGATPVILDTTLTLATNDPDEASVQVPTRLDCRPPPVPDVGAISPNPVQGGADTGQSVSGAFTFANEGELPLTYTLTSSAAWIVPAPASGTVQPGASQRIGLSMTCPSQAADYQEQITIASNDPDEASVTVDVQMRCGNTFDFRVVRAHVTQATQDPAGSVDLLSGTGWNALARAFVTASQSGAGGAVVRVHALVGGAEVGVLDMTGPATVPTSVPDDAPGRSFDAQLPADWIQPGLEVYFEVDPDNAFAELNESNNRFPASGALALPVRTLSTWPVTLVPVVMNGVTGDVNTSNAEGYLDDARRYQPVTGTDIQIHAPFTFTGSLDSSDGSGWDTLLGLLRALKTTEGSSRHYIGVVHPSYSGGIAGLGYVGFPAAVVWDRTARSSALAHEVGHNWGREHAPCGVSDADANFPYSGGGLGVWGWDRVNNTFKSPGATKDYMSYCDPIWTSDYTFKAVLAYRLAHPNPARVSEPQPVLMVRGSIDGRGVQLQPAFFLTAPEDPPEPGSLLAEALDAEGKVLWRAWFAASRVGDLPVEHFSFSAPLAPEDAARIARLRVLDERRSVLAERRALKAPVVAAVAARRGGEVVVDWAPGLASVLVRDAASGETLAIDPTPPAQLRTGAREIEVLFSDGVQTRRQLLRVE